MDRATQSRQTYRSLQALLVMSNSKWFFCVILLKYKSRVQKLPFKSEQVETGHLKVDCVTFWMQNFD